jgi:hypothetical protein
VVVLTTFGAAIFSPYPNKIAIAIALPFGIPDPAELSVTISQSDVPSYLRSTCAKSTSITKSSATSSIVFPFLAMVILLAAALPSLSPILKVVPLVGDAGRVTVKAPASVSTA